MRTALPPLVLLAALAGCGGGGFPDDVRANFLASCESNAARTAEGALTGEQVAQTCACILRRVEQEYDADAFADLERRLAAGTATSQENDRLVGWSTACAEEARA